MYLFNKFSCIYFFYFQLAAACRLSLAAVSGGCSLVAVAYHCSGFSYCIVWALGAGSVVVAHWLNCPEACEISPDQRLNSSPALVIRFFTTGSPQGSPSLYLLIPYSYLALSPFPLFPARNHYISVSLFLFCYIHHESLLQKDIIKAEMWISPSIKEAVFHLEMPGFLKLRVKSQIGLHFLIN